MRSAAVSLIVLALLSTQGWGQEASAPAPPTSNQPISARELHRPLAVVLCTGTEIRGTLVALDRETITLNALDAERTTTLQTADVQSWHLLQPPSSPPVSSPATTIEAAPSSPPKLPRRGLRVAGATTLGLGMVTLLVGAALLVGDTIVGVLNQHCRGSTGPPGCSPLERPNGQAGLSLMVVGGVGIVTGAVLYAVGFAGKEIEVRKLVRLFPTLMLLGGGDRWVGGSVQLRVAF